MAIIIDIPAGQTPAQTAEIVRQKINEEKIKMYERIDIIELTKMRPDDLLVRKYQLEKYLAAVNSVIESCYIKQPDYSNMSTISEIPVFSIPASSGVNHKVTKPKVAKKKTINGKKRGRPSKSEAIQIVPEV